MKNWKSKKGFTIMEMLVVVAVMAIIATLATGAVMKSLLTMREKKVKATISALQMAMQNYRAQQNEWPFALSDLDRVNNSQTLYEAVGEDNAVVFEGLFDSKNTYVDPSAILTRVNGARMPVKDALEKGETRLPLGFPEPTDTRKFSFFTVRYNLTTDTVKITRP